MADFNYEIVEELGILSEGSNGWGKELNYISWNEREPKFDIRSWNEDHTRMKKGISLSLEELVELKSILEDVDLNNYR